MRWLRNDIACKKLNFEILQMKILFSVRILTEHSFVYEFSIIYNKVSKKLYLEILQM